MGTELSGANPSTTQAFAQCAKRSFNTRIRVLNHVRSSACRNKVGNLPELPEEIIEMYRKTDAAEIRTARLDGRSAPTARRTSHDGEMRPGGVARPVCRMAT